MQIYWLILETGTSGNLDTALALSTVAAQLEQDHVPLSNILLKNKLKGKFHTCFLFRELTDNSVNSSHGLSLPLLSTV